MEDTSRFETLIERFAKIKERYGDEYPILFYEPNIESKEKRAFKDEISRNSSIHLFSTSGDAFKCVQSLGISFLLIASKHCDEQHILRNFGRLENIFGCGMLDFEEEALLKDLFKNASDKIIKSLKVYVFCTLLDCLTESGMKEDEEEVMTMCDIKDIAKDFRQEFIIIWFDPNISPEIKQKLEEKIEIKIEENNTYTVFADLHERIKIETIPYHLVVSGGEEAEKVVKEIEDFQDLLGLYIYCKNSEKNQKIDNEKVEIQSTIEGLVPRIKEGIRTRSKLNNSFPAFATNFDTSDRTGIYKLHYYLKGLINFKNRKQAKEKFIQLARKIYQDEEKELARFERQYNEYNKAEILRWYTKESPIYRLINNCLRISSSDSILYCRLILKDLERAIREQYQEKSKDFNGVVCRGAFLSEDEWEKLTKNIGQEIEMYGFLSTTVNQRTATNFLKADPQNKVLIKIIIPQLPDEDEQGFADISEFSAFQNEQEILFNVRSRFRILEAGVSKMDNQNTECRQLVLLYGAQLLRKYITKNKPSINIELELPPDVKCILCRSVDKLFGFKQQEETVVNCLECLIKVSMPKDTPLIHLEGEKGKRIERALPGKILASKDKIAFENSGYKCHNCKAKGKERYYKWMSCEGKEVLIQCSECLEKDKTIENKILVSETSPFSMWQESQEEWETISSDYQVDLLQRIRSEDPERVYIETENHKEGLNYAKKLFEKNVKKRRRETFKLNAFPTLGDAFMKIGAFQQALKCYTNSLGVLELIGQEKSPSGIFLYARLGAIHNTLAKHKEALEFYNQARDLGKSIYQELHPVTAFLYHGIATVYQSLSEFQKALDFFTKSLDILESVIGKKHPVTADGYNSLGLFFRELGRDQEALKYFTLALEIHESIYGEKHSSTATSYVNLASVFTNLGDYQKAIKLLNKAIHIQKSIYQGDHPILAVSYNNLAEVYQILGQYQEALKYSHKALKIDKSFYGEEHSRTACSLSNLGLIWQSLGDYQKALECLQKALSLRKSLFGEKHPGTAVSYVNIGMVYQSLGERNKALECFEGALNLQELIFAGPHSHKAASYNNIAAVYKSLGQYQKSLEYQEKALKINIALYGEEHSHTSESYNNIGAFYGYLGHHSKAIEYSNKALEIRKVIFGEMHPGNALSYNSLALSYQYLGDFQHAFKYYAKALEIQKSFHQVDHADTAIIYNNLGALHIKLGQFKKAKGYLKEALRMRRSILTENHLDVGFALNILGLLYEHLKKPHIALKYYSEAVTIFEVRNGEIHTSTANIYEKIGSLYSILGSHSEALEVQKKVLKIRQNLYEENHVDFATSYNNLGACYLDLGEYQKARDNFLKGIEILEFLYGEKHLDTYKSYENLFVVYSKLGDQKKASECYMKVLILKNTTL